MSRWATTDLTEDRFLDGRIVALQPRDGYRAAIDPVLLASAVPARSGQSVLELGCGAGVASLCLGWRVPGLALFGVELQSAYAALACRNAALNDIALQVAEADLADLPAELRQRQFDHVMANPPYFRSGAGTAARPVGRETALREATPLAVWIDTAVRRIVSGGRLTLIQQAARLPDVLAALDGRAGDVEVLPVQPREGRDAARVILKARKGARGPFRLHAPLILHAGASHTGDGEDLTPRARAVLRDGAAMSETGGG